MRQLIEPRRGFGVTPQRHQRHSGAMHRGRAPALPLPLHRGVKCRLRRFMRERKATLIPVAANQLRVIERRWRHGGERGRGNHERREDWKHSAHCDKKPEPYPESKPSLSDNLTGILQVVPALDAGGVERTTIEMAEALSQIGWRPLVASAGGRMEPALKEAGGMLLRLPLDTKSPHEIITNAFRLASIVRRRRVRLIHARSRAPAWSALLAARMTRVPFVTTYHGIYNASNLFKRFYNSVMIRGQAVIANSEWTARHIAREYHRKSGRIVVIPRGVDMLEFDPQKVSQERIAEIRAQWKVSIDEIIVLLPGRLTRWKGQLVLVDALAKLARDKALGTIHAVMIGDAQGRNDYTRDLRSAIAANGLGDHVTVAHHVTDMPAAYLAADVVVSASTDPEAFGRVTAEASAMGRPVIATNHGGSRETVLPNETGILTRPGDAVALAEALKTMVAAGPYWRKQMGERGHAYIASRFTTERMCAETIALYRELIAERR